ncbi:MAG: hypothetical protein A4E66_00634 [Syntrophus sp. PtaB.Bin001]|jgi:hypothetical protein|nr:MAG: hypothetical protein A4E66_00634 [Syntrophus sp. PtaB.Bin001]
MFEQLEKINTPPEPFEFYTAADLWTNEHTSERMLRFHLDEEVEFYADVAGTPFRPESKEFAVVTTKI